MKYNLYAIKDAKAEVFADIFQLPNNAIALRKFSEACTDEKSELHKYPEDFALYLIGSYDNETGHLSAPEQPIEIDRAVNYVKTNTAPTIN